jgi:DedD protein
MRNSLFVALGIIIIASLIFLLGYLVGRGYELREKPVARKIEKKEVIPKPRITPEIPPLKAGLPSTPLEVPNKVGADAPGVLLLTGYTVQVASSQREEKALALVDRLKTKGYPAYIEKVELKGKSWYRARVGSFKNKDDAQKLVDKLKKKEGLKDALVWKRGESEKVRK